MRGRTRRRDMMLATGLLVAFPGLAQTTAKTYRVGFFSSGTRTPAGTRNVGYESFRERLRELGYVEGRNLAIEQRYGEGRPELLAQRADELVRLNVDVILATTTTATAAAARATKTIPIVMGSAANPLASGLVSSLSRPGGNITGLTLETSETAAKRLELLREALPGLRRVAALHPAQIRSVPAVAHWLKDTAAAAKRLGLGFTAVDLPMAERERWDDVLRKTAADGLTAATIMETPTYQANRVRLAELMQKHRIAAIFPFREQAEAGGLMAYGADLADLYRRAAEFVDQILKGAKPADLPVQQPTKFTFIVNRKTARALGLNLPPAVLARADALVD